MEGDGHLVLDGCQSRQQTVTFTGAGTVTFADAAGFRFWSSAGTQWPASGPWPFLFTGATTYLYGDMGVLREKGANTLTGPMRIDGTLTQSSQGNTDYSAVFLQGPVSGSGTVSVAKRYTENNILHLLNPANTFTGGAHVEGGILCVYGDGTLPPSGTLDIEGSYDLTRQNNPGQMCDFYGVQLLGVEACTLPPLRLRGTKDVARVQGGRAAPGGAGRNVQAAARCGARPVGGCHAACERGGGRGGGGGRCVRDELRDARADFREPSPLRPARRL